jgi:hypothetical protein
MRVLYTLAVSIALGAASFSYATAGAKLDAPPPGLVPATARIADILAKHDAAAGPTTAAATSVQDWTFTDTGMSGTEHLLRSGTDYRSKIITPAGTDQYGQLAGKRWHMDPGGFTSPTTDTDDASFIPFRVAEDAADPKNDISLAGQTTGANPAYVVKVSVSGEKHPEWIFYDVFSYHIVRTETVIGTHRLVTTFDDFRTTDGITQPWHLHDAYWASEFDDDWHLTSFQTGVAVKPADFAPPANPSVTGATARAPIPAQFDYGNVIVRLTVDGRGLDFDLDPSHRRTFIDMDVAQELHLPTFGQITGLANGDRVSYDTRLPDAQIGPIHLHDLAVRATDVSYQPNTSTLIVGSLGYDFLAAYIIHIDYVHNVVEAIPNADFAADRPVANELDIPIQFDDGALLVPMDIGDGFTDRVLLNPSEMFTTVFGTYMEQHPTSFKDLDPGSHRNESAPFADDTSYGKVVPVWVSETSGLAFANLNYSDLDVISTSFDYPHDADAMLGYDYLRFFDIYFDYPHGRLLLVPNEWFYKVTTKAKPSAP